jgi:hypothetical protein
MVWSVCLALERRFDEGDVAGLTAADGTGMSWTVEIGRPIGVAACAAVTTLPSCVRGYTALWVRVSGVAHGLGQFLLTADLSVERGK